MKVSVLMDIEDLIDPLSDDAAKECADILYDLGVPGTFMVVGEKARRLLARGRSDVIHALGRHSVGLHSDMHSIHPVVLEYLHGLSWEDGVEEAVRREGRGVDAIQSAFGRPPCAWGGPGNTWGPQISDACRRLGIPAVMYSPTEIHNRDVHRFLGVLHYTHGLCLVDSEYVDREKVDERVDRLLGAVRAHMDTGVQWFEIFLGHPSRICHEQFWDIASFADGKTAPEEAWVAAPRKPADAIELALANFRCAVERIRDVKGIEIVPVDEANRTFGSLSCEPLTEEEIEATWTRILERTAGMGRWQILPRDFDLSTVLEFTREKLDTLERVCVAHPM